MSIIIFCNALLCPITFYYIKGLSKSMISILWSSYILIWWAMSCLNASSYFWWAAISSLHFAITVAYYLTIAYLMLSYCSLAVFLNFYNYLLRCYMLNTLVCCIFCSSSIFSLTFVRSCWSFPFIFYPYLWMAFESWFLWHPLIRHSGQMKVSLQVLQTYMIAYSGC